ncbi:MAG: hypothetical protein C4294_20215 [Nitrospiraceae bacterium]
MKAIRAKLQNRKVILISLGGVALIVIIMVGVGISNANTLFGLASGNTTVLHLQSTQRGGGADVSIEAWLDLANNEGKIVETASNGTLRRVELVANDTYIQYLAEANHAVIRRGLNPTSPFATVIRNQLFAPRIAAERGQAQVLGTGNIAGRVTDRLQLNFDDNPVIVDLDKTTGLTLRTEIKRPGLAPQTIETSYNLIEYVRRSDVPPKVFQLDLPANITREEYTEGLLQSGLTSGLGYAVYAAPSSEGAPIASFRRFSTARGQASSDNVYMIYRGLDGEIQVISGLPPDLTAIQASGRSPILAGNREKLELGGNVWELERENSGQVNARATLSDTYVTIHTPNRVVLERVAAGLQRLPK